VLLPGLTGELADVGWALALEMPHVHARLLVAAARWAAVSGHPCAPAGRAGALRAGGRGARRGWLADRHGLRPTAPDRVNPFPVVRGWWSGLRWSQRPANRSGSPGLPGFVLPRICLAPLAVDQAPRDIPPEDLSPTARPT
jgi:hypothetical protein